MKAKIAVLGTLRFPAGRLIETRPHLKKLIEETYKNDGCIAYDVGEDPFDLGLIRFSEVWPDRESLSRHLNAVHIKPWREEAKKCGLLSRNFIAYELADTFPV